MTKQAIKQTNSTAREALRSAAEPGTTWAARKCCLETALAAVSRLAAAGAPVDADVTEALARG